MSDKATNRMRAAGYDIPKRIPPTNGQLLQRLEERDAVIADQREVIAQLKRQIQDLVLANGTLSSELVKAERVADLAALVTAAERLGAVS